MRIRDWSSDVCSSDLAVCAVVLLLSFPAGSQFHLSDLGIDKLGMIHRLLGDDHARGFLDVLVSEGAGIRPAPIGLVLSLCAWPCFGVAAASYTASARTNERDIGREETGH